MRDEASTVAPRCRCHSAEALQGHTFEGCPYFDGMMSCGHHAANRSVLGHCRACDLEVSDG